MNYLKSIAALLGGVTPVVVIGVMSLFHISIGEDLAVQIVALVSPLTAFLATILAPKNQQKNVPTDDQDALL